MTMTSPPGLATALAGAWSALSQSSLTLSIYPYPIRDVPYDRLWLSVFVWILFVRIVCSVLTVRSTYLHGKVRCILRRLRRDRHDGPGQVEARRSSSSTRCRAWAGSMP